MMDNYIGIKLITAKSMNRLEYNEYRGWQLPSNENGLDEGYLVEYLGGGKPNHPDHKGYISWSPREQFEKTYCKTSGLTFGLAIEALLLGMKVARTVWNGKGMWLKMVGAGYYDVGVTIAKDLTLRPWIGIKTVDNQFMPWVPSQSDALAEDWQIIK